VVVQSAYAARSRADGHAAVAEIMQRLAEGQACGGGGFGMGKGDDGENPPWELLAAEAARASALFGQLGCHPSQPMAPDAAAGLWGLPSGRSSDGHPKRLTQTAHGDGGSHGGDDDDGGHRVERSCDDGSRAVGGGGAGSVDVASVAKGPPSRKGTLASRFVSAGSTTML
jgi:hypothetical protein